jgi:macrolide-specific efflux system membrane fusion protein
VIRSNQADAMNSSPATATLERAYPVAAPDLPKELRPKRKRRRLWLALVLLLAAAGGAYALWQYWLAPAPAAILLATQPVTRGDIEVTVTAAGTLEARTSVEVGAQVSGLLEAVNVEIGSVVEAGSLLAEIDDAVYQADLEADRAGYANLEAQLEERKAQLTLAEQDLARQQNLRTDNVVSQSTLEAAEAALVSAEAGVKSIEAQMREASSRLASDEATLGYTKIYAPIAGTIVDQDIVEGQTISANNSAPTVLTIADLSTMTVRAEVSEADIGKIAPGMEVYFTLLGSDTRRWTATVRQVLPTPEVSDGVVLYPVLFDVENADGRLMIGMSAQVFFVVGSADDALLVPSAAVAQLRGPNGPARSVVRVQGDDGMVTPRPVEVGITDRVSTEIVSGLSEGEKVVIPSAAATANGAAAAGAPAGAVRIGPGGAGGGGGVRLMGPPGFGG